MTDDTEYPVLTNYRGTLDFAKVARIWNDKYGRSAVLAEPFGSRMGTFSYEDLLKRGRAESQGFTTYTPEFWKANRDAEITRTNKQWFPKGVMGEAVANSKESEHRRLLGLPDKGGLLKSEVEQAYKATARRAHPDAGGSEEAFKQLGAAKDTLITTLATLKVIPALNAAQTRLAFVSPNTIRKSYSFLCGQVAQDR